MKSSHLSLAQLISCLAILLLAQSIAGQAISCGTGDNYAEGPINVMDGIQRLEIPALVTMRKAFRIHLETDQYVI